MICNSAEHWFHCFVQVVDPERSQVKMLGAKVEINLRKAEPGSWSNLERPKQKTTTTEEESEEEVDFE